MYQDRNRNVLAHVRLKCEPVLPERNRAKCPALHKNLGQIVVTHFVWKLIHWSSQKVTCDHHVSGSMQVFWLFCSWLTPLENREAFYPRFTALVDFRPLIRSKRTTGSMNTKRYRKGRPIHQFNRAEISKKMGKPQKSHVSGHFCGSASRENGFSQLKKL